MRGQTGARQAECVRLDGSEISSPRWARNSGAVWGPDTITFEVQENFTGSPRTGTLTVAGKTFTVLQDSGLPDCLYLVSPASASVSASGGSGIFNVFCEQRCAWVASSEVAWITIASNGMRIGNGIVNYSVAANATGTSRKGRITLAGQVFTVKQT